MTHRHSLCANSYFFFLFFSILANLYRNFETGKLPAHERNNFIFHVNMHFCNIVLFHKYRYWVLSTQPRVSYSTKILQFCRQMSKHVSYETIFIWYGIRLQVNVVPQCRNTLQYVVSYVKFLEDFAQTMYCSSNEWLWATNVLSHNFRQKRCYTMMTFWRTNERFYMACWIPISIIYNFNFN
jgi:hypothetical protein